MGDKPSKQAKQPKDGTGDKQSKKTKQPNLPPLLETTWREGSQFSNWNMTEKHKLIDTIRDFKIPEAVGIDHLNVLLLGEISSGKSSLYNNFDSVFQTYVSNKASVGLAEDSLTKIYKMYTVIKDPKYNKSINFSFWDCMGLEDGDRGLKDSDVVDMLDGKIESGTNLSTLHPTKTRTARKENKIHCVLFVVNAVMLQYIPPGVVEKWRQIRAAANSRGLTPIVILTHVDKICPAVANDPSKVFFSRAVDKQVVVIKDKLGITKKEVCPVMNYTDQTELQLEIDMMTLLAFVQISRSCNSYIQSMQ